MSSTPSSHRWLLLIHQIPAKPSGVRVKVWRRLQQIGAVGVKNSVYALPCTADALEDFQWLKQEIEDAGGEATLLRADALEEADDRDIEALFQDARSGDYTRLLSEAQALRQRIQDETAHHAAERLDQWETELLKLRDRCEQTQRIDFFASPVRADAEAALRAIADLLARTVTDVTREAPRFPDRMDLPSLRGRLWATRARIYVDRMACGWLIRRFIDPDARFVFIDPAQEQPPEGAIPFDMAGAEFGHHGDRCSFETFVDVAGLVDPALATIGQIVHDIDLKDHKFARPEAAGIRLALDGLAGDDDAAALDRASVVFDAIYAALAAPLDRPRG